MSEEVNYWRTEASDIMGWMLSYIGQFTNIRLAELICIENGYSMDEIPVLEKHIDEMRSRASRFMAIDEAIDEVGQIGVNSAFKNSKIVKFSPVQER